MAGLERARSQGDVVATIALKRSDHGVSGSFLVRADDDRRYWCKVVNNPASPRIPVNEQLAGRVGRLIGAATCEVALVEIPEALVGWEFRDGHHLEAGCAHGSVAIDPAVETRTLADRSSDDNARRHAGFYALHDWLAGSDDQWLYCPDEENAYYSHDHGGYFPGGPAWTVDSLQQHGTTASPLGMPPDGLDAAELDRLASSIQQVEEEDLMHEVTKIPEEWPVADDELEELIRFLLRRRQGTADRLRGMIGS